MPSWQFGERHRPRVRAEPVKVFAAIRAVEARDVFLLRTLTAIRRGWQRTGENILNLPPGEPILDVVTRTGFRYVASDLTPDITAAMNFVVEPDGRGGSNVSTETRVLARTKRAKRLFALYWFAIRGGSGFLRRMWLRAVKRRAE